MTLMLPPNPSFGERLGTGIGAGLGGGVSKGISGMIEQARLLEKEREKRKGLEQIFAPQAEGQAFQQLSAPQKAILALTDPGAFKAYEIFEQGEQKKAEEVKKKEGLTDVVTELTDTLLKGNLGYTPKKFTAKGRRDAQYFDSLALQLESIGRELVSKGVLSEKRFAYLLSNIPSSKKTDAGNAGSLEAWSRELGLEVPELEGLKKLYEKEPKGKGKLKNVPKGTHLTQEALQEIMDVVGEENAFKTAEKMGYVFRP